jgi:hypothetical protein
VDGQPDRPALVGKGACHRLPDPPGRICGQLVAHSPVELLDRPDQPEVSLLDQIEQRDASLRVVPGDPDHEAQVGLDQPLLGLFVALVLALG